MAGTVDVVRPPVCEICDARVDPTADGGGLVTFQPDDRSRDWHRRAAEEPGFVGHPPDVGWFCAAHIDAARAVARTSTFGEGMRRLLDAGAPADTTGPDLDREPDLVGVDLGRGRLVTSDRGEVRWVEWRVPPIDAHAWAASMRSLLPVLFEAFGLGPAPTLEQRSDRRWNPTDGAQPPWCPFTDTTIDAAAGADGTRVELCVVLDHWNEDAVANASVSMTIGDRLAIRAHRANGTGSTVDTVRLGRPTTAAVVAVVAALVH